MYITSIFYHNYSDYGSKNDQDKLRNEKEILKIVL